ncbi:MAG TPA: Gfo/Idh/MocA family oxidoreductase [Fodinibius sp.]|nr:Gfo/Idh/MocA family oxidoreductase [Fodinibius sp.]
MEYNNQLRWGVLSTAKIARQKVIPAMQQGRYSKVVAIASRSRDRAAEAAESLDIPKAAGSYERLLAMPEIDAIYNPLPNHLHIPWTINALEAGKHVLCEKPIGLSVDEARGLLDETEKYPDLKVMEAFMYRHHPRWIKARELIAEGVLGKVQSIHSFFSYYNDDPDNIRNKPDIGGGGLMDIGCYCISVPRFLLDEEPLKVMGSLDIDPKLQVDRRASAVMEFKSATATFTCATQLAPHQKVTIVGTEATMEIPMPFNAPTDKTTSLLLQTEAESREITFEACNQYTAQGDLFSKAVLDNTQVPTPLTDALANLQVLEAIKQSSQHRQWVNC